MDFGLFIVVLFIIAVIMRVDFFFYILYVFAGVYVISRVWIGRAVRQVHVKRLLDAQAFFGEKVPVRLEVKNDGWLPIPWLQLRETLPQPLAFPPVRSQALSLWPHEQSTFTYELDCRQRGYYAIGPLQISSGDLLDAGGRVFAEAGVSHLTVFPRLLSLDELGIPSRSPFGTIQRPQAIHRDPSRAAGVREYQPGDSLRHINWKSSAATGKLQTKVFDPVIALDTAVIVDLERAHYAPAHAIITTEEAISAAASLVVQLARRRQPFSLACNGADPLGMADTASPYPVADTASPYPVADTASPYPVADTASPNPVADRGPVVPMRAGQAHLTTVLAALGRVENRESEPFDVMLEREVLGLPWGCTVLIVSGNGAGLQAHALRLRRSGYVVVIVLADYHSDIRQSGRELERTGATVFRLRSTEQLAKVAT